MNYRSDKYGKSLSILGYGCMRFPQTMGKINMEETEQQIMAAFRGGVNYYDTAYIYPGSEAALGEILEKNGIRDQVMIATKLPHYLIRSRETLDKLFSEQLKRLRTDRIDYYLMHMLTDVMTWERMKQLGVVERLRDKQKNGQIGQIGFSYHGNSDMFCQLVDAFDWDFCQIQYNYLDENSQAGRRGLNYAHQKGLPVIIMEPLRGGKLVNRLPEEALRVFAKHPSKRTPAQWAFRWLWNQPEVTCVLSGMNTLEMIEDNLQTASTVSVGEFGDSENELLQQVVAAIHAKMRVGCTGCGYCMPCPKHVDIPGTFAAYNRRYTESRSRGFIEYMMCTAFRKNSTAASNCIHCGKCEQHCPQQIQIRKELDNARKDREGPIYKIVRKLVEIFRIF